MTGPREPSDPGYQSWWDIAHGCRHLADTLRCIGRATPATQSPAASARERADAHTLLSACLPGLFREAARLASAAQRMADAERLAEASARVTREGGA